MLFQYLSECQSVKPMLEEYWKTFLDLIYFWGDFLRLESLFKAFTSRLTLRGILSSTWFPVAMLIIGGFFLLKKEHYVTALIYLSTLALYIVYYLVPMVSVEFGGILVFGGVLLTVSVIAIYFLFIRSE